MESVLYFDHAASSWPKPPAVMEAMNRCMLEYTANPGRGSHKMAVKASRTLFETRKHLAKLFKIKNPNDISFALNTTQALNQAIQGFLKKGDHVICTHLEHNSVRRPLEYLKSQGHITVSYISSDEKGKLDWESFQAALQSNTSLCIVNHSSNLLGSIVDVGSIGEVCKARGVRLLVDAAQSAGVLPINVEAMNIDMLAFPGHKGLLGPQGTGGLYLHPDLELEPIFYGGTGSQSESLEQPKVRPDRYEAGTQNTVGIAGLNEGVKFILKETVEVIHQKEWKQTQWMMEELSKLKGLRILGPDLGGERTGIVSFVMERADSSEVAFILDQSYNIAVRAGYHCTPLAHEIAGTKEKGAVRASVGYFTKEEEVQAFIDAITEINKHYTKF